MLYSKHISDTNIRLKLMILFHWDFVRSALDYFYDKRQIYLQNFIIAMKHIFHKNDVMTNAILHLFVCERINFECLFTNWLHLMVCYTSINFHVKCLNIDNFVQRQSDPGKYLHSILNLSLYSIYVLKLASHIIVNINR